VALVGNLRDFSLSDFLYLVDRGYKTGALNIQRTGDAARLYFQNGKLVYALKHGGEEKLGDLLLRVGKISRDQRDHALHLQRTVSPEKPVGLILVEQTYISKEEIVRCVRAQLEETVYSLFGWSEGDFRFEPGIMPPPETVTIPLSIENIIMEGVRRIDEWSRIRDRIPSLDVVVRFADQPTEKAKEVNLTPDEWRVFARISASTNVGNIAELTNLSEFEVCRIVYGFLQAGLVEVVKERLRPGEPRPSSAPVQGTIPREGSIPRVRESERPNYPLVGQNAAGRLRGDGTMVRQSEQPAKKGLIRQLIERIRGI